MRASAATTLSISFTSWAVNASRKSLHTSRIAHRPASVRTCALLHKADRAEVDVDIDYIGFSIPDKWVVGYGLDYAEQNRTLPYIGIIEPEV